MGLRTVRSSEEGASAILIALSLFLLIGIAALAIDIAEGFNERRQDQSAADVGVMAGAIEVPSSSTAIRDEILDFTQRNVIGSYSDWQSKWESCVDDEKTTLNASGFSFVPLPAPAGWSVTSIDCISIDQGGFVRVALPDLEFDTSFARVLGVEELETSADAIAEIGNRGGGGILPFGLLSTAGEGQHVCLRDNSGGLAEEPCDGPDAGNFGAIESPHYGTKPDGPPRNCTASPKSQVLATNIAFGIDHLLALDTNGSSADEINDTCGEMDLGNTPDTMNTFQGLSGGLAEGMATGPVPGGYMPRLQKSSVKKFVHGYNLDDVPLWNYIDPLATDIPASCTKTSFAPTAGPPTFDYSIPADGVPDPPDSWQHMSYCFDEYLNGTYSGVLFLDNDVTSIADSPRFSYVPQFWEDAWPSGNSAPRHIKAFKATWIQATWWKKGNTVSVFHPGEGGSFNQGGNWQLRQLSGIVIPDDTLPMSLRGSTSGSGVNPFEAQLYR